jgi:hypothetical protein
LSSTARGQHLLAGRRQPGHVLPQASDNLAAAPLHVGTETLQILAARLAAHFLQVGLLRRGEIERQRK